MCGGVYYQGEEGLERCYFSNPGARLPILMRDGRIALLPWGRRQRQQGQLPMGGWASLKSIQGGYWDRWFPVPVKCPVQSFMEKDITGNSQWFDLTAGQYVQGLVARSGPEQRVYVVTLEPEREDTMFERWPRVVSAGKG